MLTQRLGKPHQTDDAYIDRLLSMIRDNPGSCDEIWFASLYGYVNAGRLTPADLAATLGKPSMDPLVS